MANELPQKQNRRGGPGWWMDSDGAWRAPADWPGDYPPIDGWVKDADGRWVAPTRTSISLDAVRFTTGADDDTGRDDAHSVTRRPVAESAKSRSGSHTESSIPDKRTKRARSTESPRTPRRSRQAEADIRAMLFVGGAIGVCVLLVITAFVLQSRAEAVSEVEAAPEEAPEVVFAAETNEVREARRAEAVAAAPGIARGALAELPIVEPLGDDELRSTADVFDETQWVAAAPGCLDAFEEVLLARSSTPVVFADNLDCVPAEGQWTDNYLNISISRTIDAEVRYLVPAEVVHASGGSAWSPATRADYLADVSHRPTFAVLAQGTGHNPRNAGPETWRPSNESTWCGYAVDWVAVKARWELSVSAAEASALAEMLETCNDPTSSGVHEDSVMVDRIEPPVIERINNG